MHFRRVVFECVFQRFPIDGHAAQRRTPGSVIVCHGSSFRNRLPRGGLTREKRTKWERWTAPPAGAVYPMPRQTLGFGREKETLRRNGLGTGVEKTFRPL